MEITIEKIMAFLLRRKASNLPSSALADIFDRLIWCVDEACQGEMVSIHRQWLLSDNKDKIDVALEMCEIFPFDGEADAKSLLGQIALKNDEFKPRCDKIFSLYVLHLAGKGRS